MRKKINGRFVGIALFSIVVTALCMAAIFYNRLETQVLNDLEVIASILSDDFSKERIPTGIRVTIIESDGTVRFDSMADEHIMENHMDRPEVSEAFTNGSGHEIRMSDTLSENIYYYALKMSDGSVIRVGKESVSVIWIFISALPVVCLVIIILIAICLIASRYLTTAIVRPIEDMIEDMEHVDENVIYEELVPFTRKIRSQHEEILSAANMRQEFTANVSHELKTPLAAISGYAELMAAGVAGENDIRHFSQEIRKSAERLLNLINDIIKLSKLDSGETGESKEQTDISIIAGDTFEMLKINASKAEVIMECDICESAKIHISHEYAEELMYNLVENAIRYNRPGGRVLIKVWKDDYNVRLTVSDTGIGIPKEYQKRIFERFYRVDKSRSKELGGTGLGLAIVKHICELSGGEIKLESESGDGTEIQIEWVCEHV